VPESDEQPGSRLPVNLSRAARDSSRICPNYSLDIFGLEPHCLVSVLFGQFLKRQLTTLAKT
jgi:hypothetical protein